MLSAGNGMISRKARFAATVAVLTALTASVGLSSADAKTIQPQTVSPPVIRVPYSGTSELSFKQQAGLMPLRATSDLGRTDIISHFAIQDATHFRFDVHRAQPALQTDNETVVANGTSVILYSNSVSRAVQFPIGGSGPSAELLLAEFSGTGLPSGFSAQQIVDALKNSKSGAQASIVGEDTILGRTTDVVEISPVGSTVVGPLFQLCAVQEEHTNLWTGTPLD